MKSLDQKGFEALFRDHYKALCHFGIGIIGDGETAEDIVQQAFVKLWNKREEMDMNRSLKSYLYTTVRNRCINHIRDQKKFRSEILDIDVHASGSVSGFMDGDESLQTDELRNRIEQAMAALPEKSREVFLLSRMEQMKYREIAEKLGVTVKTVEAHMSKALKILREELKDYLVGYLLLLAGCCMLF